MTREQYLYLKLIEECAEVQQRASKLMQFGENESPNTAPANLREDAPVGTNRERLQEEIVDLTAVIRLLGYNSATIQQTLDKQTKNEKYRAYSETLGRVL